MTVTIWSPMEELTDNLIFNLTLQPFQVSTVNSFDITSHQVQSREKHVLYKRKSIMLIYFFWDHL